MEKWFSGGLIGWYRENKRDLPWRHEKDPYRIWLSEVILQQTQVVQGLSYYLKFIEKYPSVTHLANAPEDEVLKLWQGLGYYSRARNLHAAAKSIQNDFKGKFPASYPEIRALKGIGDYTAAAIASFAYDLPHAVVDGNVYRVLSRVFGIEVPIDSSAGKKQFQELAARLLNKKDPATNNQAIMEFGSQFCKPVKPDCQRCILREKCYAFKAAKVSELPVKEKKTKIRNRYFHYLVIADKQGNILVRKRDQQDIWKGLYEFSLIETEKEIAPDALFATEEFRSACGAGSKVLHVSGSYKHILTHQHLHAKFYVVRVARSFEKGQATSSVKKLTNLAFPRLIEKFLDNCGLIEML